MFLAGAWQDEQTGGHFPTMLDQFTGTDALLRHDGQRAAHRVAEPGVFARYVEFLDLYVGQRTPSLDAARGVAPILAPAIFGTDGVEPAAGPVRRA